MNRKAVSGIMLSLLLVGMLMLAFNIQPIKAEPRAWTVDDDGPADFSSIQEAINSAGVKNGDTIFVYNGTYYENVVVNKTVSLIGENKTTTIIDGNGTGTIVTIVTNGAAIDSFTIQNGEGGVLGFHISSVRIINNNILNCSSGIGCWGTNLMVNHNKITDCTYDGMSLLGIDSSTVIGNFVANSLIGLEFFSGWLGGGKNIFRNNTISDNEFNFGHGSVSGGWMENIEYFIMNDIDTSNTINGKPVYYWINEHDKEIPLDAGYVELVNCTNIVVRNLNLSKNIGSVILANSENCTVEYLDITDNYYWGLVLAANSSNNLVKNNYIRSGFVELRSLLVSGIWLSKTKNNSIIRNSIVGSIGISLLVTENNIVSQNNMVGGEWGIGVLLQNTRNNAFYHNNFINSTASKFDHPPPYLPSINVWDDGYPSGGNYWSNYPGVDLYRGPHQNETGSDGIGDSPHTIDENNQDNYPLMNPYVPLLGDLNDDRKVDMKDLAIAALAFGSYPTHPRWNPIADINNDGKVDMRDIVVIARNFGKTYS